MLYDKVNEAFDFIVAYKAAHDGCAPTHREIAEAIGVQSMSYIKTIIDMLVADGRIKRVPMSPRNIEIIGGEWTYNG